jgi:hypothetical protein
MIISPYLVLGLAAALWTLALYRRSWAFGVWLGCYLVFPTAFTKLGEAPVYLYDVATLVLVAVLWGSGDLRRWPANAPRWHLWFIGGAFVLSVVGGAARYGPMPELLWIWGHTSLAWLAFMFGVVAFTSLGGEAYRAALQWTVLASLAILAGLAVVQYADLPGSESISEFFYGDLGSVRTVEILRIGPETNRATGPHNAPTGFSGIALLSLAALWLAGGGRAGWMRWTALGLAATVLLCTVSRHTMLAAALAFGVALALAEARRKALVVGAGLVAAVLVVVSADTLLLKNSWSYRLSKTDEGFLQDDNIAARLLWGPARLAERIAADPSLLLTGAGLDPEKLAAKARGDLHFETGFVSNGFLLALYYLGVGGFVFYALFWLWTAWSAWRLPPVRRAAACGFTVMAVLIVAADNYSFMYEPAIGLLALLAGLVGGLRHHEQCADGLEALPEEPEVEPQAEPEAAIAPPPPSRHAA